MTDAYLEGVRALYDGEVFGERVLLTLYAAAKAPRDAYHFATILQLETETKARLRPLMLKYGLGLDETGDPAVIPPRVEAYLGGDWRGYAVGMAVRLRPILTRYEAIAALGPSEDQPILQAVVRHEAALLAWAEAEAEGPSDESLAPIIALLNFPVTPPA
jgi:hypothetical protein